MKRTTSKKFTESDISKRIYSTIDELPLWNFKKINETKDLNYLLKDENTKAGDEELEKIWSKIAEELNQLQGVGDQLQKWLLLQIDLEGLIIDLLSTNDKSIITEINIKKKQISKLEKELENGSGDFDEQIAAVELYFKFHIDEKTTTVKRFFNYINLMKKQSAQNVKR